MRGRKGLLKRRELEECFLDFFVYQVLFVFMSIQFQLV